MDLRLRNPTRKGGMEKSNFGCGQVDDFKPGPGFESIQGLGHGCE